MRNHSDEWANPAARNAHRRRAWRSAAPEGAILANGCDHTDPLGLTGSRCIAPLALLEEDPGLTRR